MKLKDLIRKLDGDVVIYINGKQYVKELSEEMLNLKIVKIDIETRKADIKGLEELGYSFEVGV